jgi:hypothetical protein
MPISRIVAAVPNTTIVYYIHWEKQEKILFVACLLHLGDISAHTFEILSTHTGEILQMVSFVHVTYPNSS